MGAFAGIRLKTKTFSSLLFLVYAHSFVSLTCLVLIANVDRKWAFGYVAFISEHTKLVYLEFEQNHLAVLGKMCVSI